MIIFSAKVSSFITNAVGNNVLKLVTSIFEQKSKKIALHLKALIGYLMKTKIEFTIECFGILDDASTNELPMFNILLEVMDEASSNDTPMNKTMIDMYDISQYQEKLHMLDDKGGSGVGNLRFHPVRETAVPYGESIFHFKSQKLSVFYYYSFDNSRDGKYVKSLRVLRKMQSSNEFFNVSTELWIIIDENGQVACVNIPSEMQSDANCGSNEILFKEDEEYICRNMKENLYIDYIPVTKPEIQLKEKLKSDISKRTTETGNDNRYESSVLKNSKKAIEMERPKPTKLPMTSRQKHTAAKSSASKRFYIHVNRHDEIRCHLEEALDHAKLRNIFTKTPDDIPYILWPSGHVSLPYKLRFIMESCYNNEYMERLHSFLLKKNKKDKNWSNDKIVRPEPLVNAGFSYEGNDDEVVCKICGCKSRTDEWSDDDDEEYAESIHRQYSPDCAFFTNKSLKHPYSEEQHHLMRENSQSESENKSNSFFKEAVLTTYFVHLIQFDADRLVNDEKLNTEIYHNSKNMQVDSVIEDVLSPAMGNTFVPSDYWDYEA